jgi:hypothetical protein
VFITKNNKEIKYHFKETSYSLSKKVNIWEMVTYKYFEIINLGPNCFFAIDSLAGSKIELVGPFS